VGDAAYWVGDLERGLLASREALDLSRPGSRSACRAIATMVITAVSLRRPEALRTAMERLLRDEPDPDALAPLAWAFNSAIGVLMFTAERRQAEVYLRRLLHVAGSAMERDDDVTGLVERTR